MGNASQPPFGAGQGPAPRVQLIQWINVRDPSDPIASRLFSPRGPLPNRHEIQEVAISSSHTPSPGNAHTGYFESELAAKVLYDACILGRDTLQLQTERPLWSSRLGNGLRFATTSAALLLIWSVVIGASGYVIGSSLLMNIGQGACAALLTVLAVLWLSGAALDRLHKLSLDH